MARRAMGWRSRLEVRRATRRLLRQLDIQPPLDVAALASRLGHARGRPIQLVERDLPVPGPSGLYLRTDETDIVVYQRETTHGHQEHIILHEIGHIISNHYQDQDDDVWRLLAPDLSPELVRTLLRRTGYDTAHEHEAELVATVIKQWAGVLEHLRPAEAPPTRPREIEGALDDHQGWL